MHDVFFYNSALFFGAMVLGLVWVVGLHRFFGKDGLYLAIVSGILICNLEVTKGVEILGIAATSGNVMYAVIFLATDMLTEFYGEAAAKRGVYLGFIAALTMIGSMQITLCLQPAPFDQNHGHLAALFQSVDRVTLASLCAYMLSQRLDIWLYLRIRSLTEGRWLWMRNNGSTATSQLLDSFVFVLIAFYGTMPNAVLLEIAISTYVLKLILAVSDTPFLYWARRHILNAPDAPVFAAHILGNSKGRNNAEFSG